MQLASMRQAASGICICPLLRTFLPCTAFLIVTCLCLHIYSKDMHVASGWSSNPEGHWEACNHLECHRRIASFSLLPTFLAMDEYNHTTYVWYSGQPLLLLAHHLAHTTADADTSHKHLQQDEAEYAYYRCVLFNIPYHQWHQSSFEYCLQTASYRSYLQSQSHGHYLLRSRRGL